MLLRPLNGSSTPNTFAVDFIAFKSLTRILSPPESVDIGCPILDLLEKEFLRENGVDIENSNKK